MEIEVEKEEGRLDYEQSFSNFLQLAGQQWSPRWMDILPYRGRVIHRENSSMVGLFRPMGCSLGGDYRYTVGNLRGIRRGY